MSTSKSRKRRQYRSGSISQRKDGLWVGRIEAGTDRNGRRRRIVVSAKTETLCKERLEAKKREIARNGVPEQGSGRRVTVEEWSKTWLRMARSDMRPKSYQTAKSSVDVWIVPTIGRKRLDSITPADVRSVIDAIRAAGRKEATSVRTHSVLMSLLKAAKVEGHDVAERVFLVRKPRLGESDRQAMALDDALAVLKVAAGREDAANWVAVLLQGLRQGERLGLTWSCVDFERDLIDISWQLQPLPYFDNKDKSKGFRVPAGYTARHLTQAFHLVRPKSAKSRRLIPMTPTMRAALLAWREIAPANDHDLVWSTAEGLPVREENDRADWKAIQQLADVSHPTGRRYVLHEGRHTTATLLLQLGVDKDVVEAILGHSKFVVTYDHSDRTARAREALGQLDAQLAVGAA